MQREESIEGRSRKGAWIEIKDKQREADFIPGRSRKGAWIEILSTLFSKKAWNVAPARERGLKY